MQEWNPNTLFKFLDSTMPNKSATPIPNASIRQEIENYVLNDRHVDKEEYTKTFADWLLSSKNNTITHLNDFVNKSFTYGTVQSFDHFFLRHKNKRFRFFKGEFMYHQASLKYDAHWSYLNDDYPRYDDAVILSVPFSDSGMMPPELNSLLHQCQKKDVPVLLDLAYFPTAKNLEINLSYKCIETVCCSLSKAFDGAQYLRAGIRFQRTNIDDGIDIFNSVNMFPHHTMSAACYLMNKFSVDYNWNTYETHYEEICKNLNLQPTNTIMFGLSQTDYQEFNRGNDWNRVCISEDIGERYASSKS